MSQTDATLIDELEDAQVSLTEAIVAEYHKLKEALGDRPMWGKKRSPQERLQYYETIKGDPDEWDRIIKKSGPGEALKFAIEMERERTKQFAQESVI